MYSTIEEANLKVNNGSELGVESFLFEGGGVGVRSGRARYSYFDRWVGLKRRGVILIKIYR